MPRKRMERCARVLMDLHFTDADGSVLGSIIAWVAMLATAIGWWFHVRRLTRADKMDSGISESLAFVLKELRTEIGRLGAENIELRGRVAACEARWTALQEAVAK